MIEQELLSSSTQQEKPKYLTSLAERTKRLVAEVLVNPHHINEQRQGEAKAPIEHVLKGARSVIERTNALVASVGGEKTDAYYEENVLIEKVSIKSEQKRQLFADLLSPFGIQESHSHALAAHMELNIAAGGIFVIEYDSDDEASAEAVLQALQISSLDNSITHHNELINQIGGFTPRQQPEQSPVIFIDKKNRSVNLTHEVHEAVTDLLFDQIGKPLHQERSKQYRQHATPAEIATHRHAREEVRQTPAQELFQAYSRNGYAELIANLESNISALRDTELRGFDPRDLQFTDEKLTDEHAKEATIKALTAYESSALFIRALKRTLATQIAHSASGTELASLLRVYMHNPIKALEILDHDTYALWQKDAKDASERIVANANNGSLATYGFLVSEAYGIAQNQVVSDIEGRFINAKPNLKKERVVTTITAEQFMVTDLHTESGAWSSAAIGVQLGPAKRYDINGHLYIDYPFLDANGNPTDKGYRVKTDPQGIESGVYYTNSQEVTLPPIDQNTHQIFIKQLLVPHLKGIHLGGSNLVERYQRHMQDFAKDAIEGKADPFKLFMLLENEFTLLHDQPGPEYPELRRAIAEINQTIPRIYTGSGRMTEITHFITQIRDLVDNHIVPEINKAESRALREYSTGIRASAKNKHFARILGISRSNEGDWFLIQELKGKVSGEETLKQRPNGISEQEAITLLASVTDALMTLQEGNEVHRDIKPANIRFDIDSQTNEITEAYLIDAGIVGKKGQPVEGNQSTIPVLYDAETRIGAPIAQTQSPEKGTSRAHTIQYAPLEQIQGTSPLSYTMDIAALGATVMELISGERPDTLGLTAIADKTVRAQQIKNVLQAKNISSQLTELITKMVSFDPADRHQNAIELRQEIRNKLLSPYDVIDVRTGFTPDSLHQRTSTKELADALRENLFPPNLDRTRTIKMLIGKLINESRQNNPSNDPVILADFLDYAIAQYSHHASQVDYPHVTISANGTPVHQIDNTERDSIINAQNAAERNGFSAGMSWTAHILRNLQRIHQHDPHAVLDDLYSLVNMQEAIHVRPEAAILSGNELLLSEAVSRRMKQEFLELKNEANQYRISAVDLAVMMKDGYINAEGSIGYSGNLRLAQEKKNKIKEFAVAESIRRLHEFVTQNGAANFTEFLSQGMNFRSNPDLKKLLESFSPVVGGYLSRDSLLADMYFPQRIRDIQHSGADPDRAKLLAELQLGTDFFFYMHTNTSREKVAVDTLLLLGKANSQRTASIGKLEQELLDKAEIGIKVNEIKHTISSWKTELQNQHTHFSVMPEIENIYKEALNRHQAYLVGQISSMFTRLSDHEYIIPPDKPMPARDYHAGMLETGTSKQRIAKWRVEQSNRQDRSALLQNAQAELIGIIQN